MKGKKKKKFLIPLRIRRIDRSGYHVFVKGSVNGKKVNLLLDTGASRSVFDREKLLELLNPESIRNNPEMTMGIGADSVESQIAVIARLKVGDFEILKMKTVLMDMASVNKAFEMIGIPQVQGILGGDILKKYEACVDYRKKTLLLYK